MSRFAGRRAEATTVADFAPGRSPPGGPLPGQSAIERSQASPAATALLVGGAAVGIQAAMALAGLIVARDLAVARYGEVAYFFSVFGIAILLGSFGLSTQVTTEVARLVGTGKVQVGGDEISVLFVARLATVALLAAIAGLVAARGDGIAAVAAIAGGVALLTGFGFGVAQGLGKARLVAGLQLTQALAYLGIVTEWAGREPESIFATVIATYSLSFLGALFASRELLTRLMRPRRRVVEMAKAIVPLTGSVYLLTLLLAPYGAVAVLALGKAGAFERAANVSIALALTGPLSAALATVISVHYYPRFCELLARQNPTYREFFEGFYRPVAALAILAAVILALYPSEVIAVLYTPRYLAVAATLRAMAPAAGILAVGQLLVWTLWAHGRERWALSGAFAQLLVLLAAVALAVWHPTWPPWWLGLGHSLAAASGLTVWSVGLSRLKPAYRWHVGRLIVVSGAALALGWSLHSPVAAFDSNRLASAVALAVATLLVGALVAGLIVPIRPWLARARP